MKDRIKELRKTLNLNQTDFGLRIGVKQGTVASYENGHRVPLDTVIVSICKEFGVSRAWLESGVEPMFVEAEDEDLKRITRAMEGTSANKKKLMRILADMPDELLDKFMEYLESKA